MHRTTPLSATGFSCAARPVARSTCIAWGNRLSTGPVGACSRATPSTVSIAALISGLASVLARSRDDSDAANTAVGDGLIPSCLRMSATASSTAVTCFDSADEDVRFLSYSSATGSPISKPSSSAMSSNSRDEAPTYSRRGSRARSLWVAPRRRLRKMLRSVGCKRNSSEPPTRRRVITLPSTSHTSERVYGGVESFFFLSRRGIAPR